VVVPVTVRVRILVPECVPDVVDVFVDVGDKESVDVPRGDSDI
jgi:hypothetical protein